ncbi:MAG TPA: glycosyltransferase family 39 protein [Myxococcota bacterium]|nr:glycosyltransferase family 39 protein [Myxococcota bacterium]HRY94943.1 glycosyltransferase family 39 protein [Myxococcota bacterium]HSA22609.1 glycosyltransferase family 39 protein [Myxococcota bacterium]
MQIPELPESPPSPDSRRREMVILAGILSLAFTARALFLSSWAESPLFHLLYGDEGNFHRTALAILGQGGEADAFFYQPFYSLWLALVYGLFGVDTVLVRSLQLGLGLVGVGLAYGLGRELGGRRVAAVSGLLAGLYGPFVFLEGQLLAESLAVPLLTGALWCLVRAGRRERVWLLLPAGLLAGLTCMARPNLLLALPAPGLWWLLVARGWRRRLAGAGLAVAGVLLGLSPSWIFNLARGQAATPISSSAGISFFLGNNPSATGRFHVPRGLKIDASSHAAYQRSLQHLAEEAEGRPLSPAEASSHWTRRGLAFWAETPRRALALFGRKLLLAVNAEEMPIHHPYFVVREQVPVLGWLLPFGVIFPLSALGLWLGRRRRGVGLLLGCLAAYTLTLAIFYVADRYRVLLVPMLLPLAGLGVVALHESVRARGALRSAPALVALALAALLCAPRLVPEETRARSFYLTYVLMGKAMGDQGDLQAAEGHFRRAIEVAGPEHGATARVNLGLVRELRGDPQGARELYRQATRMDPEERGAWRKLAVLTERLGDKAEALAAWRALAALQTEPAEELRQAARLEAELAPPPEPPPEPVP